MEEVKETLSNMMTVFQKRMADFETELTKAPNTPNSTMNLSSDFAAFKMFMLQSLGSLQKQVEMLAQDVYRLEMRTRRKMLLLHGLPEKQKEETAEVVASIIKERLQMPDFTVSDIKRCHRMGRESAEFKPRPIAIKLQRVEVRDLIWFAKTKLKGSGITVSEFLTKSRHNTFMAAREKFGVNKCWTREGHIFVLRGGSRHRISSLHDVNNMDQEPQEDSAITASPVKIAVPRPRRAAAAKK